MIEQVRQWQTSLGKWAGMLSPDAFPHSVKEIQLFETHISWVILTGEYVYKLKKPVNFGFLDYSTLFQRQACCQLELERNRQWAPDIYIDVVGLHFGKQCATEQEVGMSASGDIDENSLNSVIRIGTPDTDVEWAVRMHQFSQHDCLDNLQRSGELRSEDVDSLAEHLSEVHKSAEHVSLSQRWGTSELVKHELSQCFVDVQRVAKELGAETLVESLKQWGDSECGRLSELIDERRKSGFVRQCHGDLHLGNLIRWHNQVVGFDAIEFNPEYFWLDTWSEVAFTIMDLEVRGEARLAARLTTRYAEASGDYQGLALLRLFKFYRAIVRARVSSLRLAELDREGEEFVRCSETIRSYCNLADRYRQPLEPTLWITHGISGSGKSWGAMQWCEHHRAVRIRSDLERKRLLGVPWNEAAPPEAYSSEVSQATYHRIAELAELVLKSGSSAVVDAAFLRRCDRDQFRSLATELGVGFGILAFEASQEELLRRVHERLRLRSTSRKIGDGVSSEISYGADPSDATIEVVQQQLIDQEPLDENEKLMVVNR